MEIIENENNNNNSDSENITKVSQKKKMMSKGGKEKQINKSNNGRMHKI